MKLNVAGLLRAYWKQALAIGGALILALAAGGLLFSWSGIYSVAASEGHLAIVDWFLRFSMRNSVKTQASAIEPPALNDQHLVTLGGAHYYTGCMPCHGGPGHQPNAVFQHSLPKPPDLTDASRQWKDRELFWLVKHGIKYTGMPGWSGRDRNDEQWAVVAFLKELPSLNKDSYDALALGGFASARVFEDEPSTTPGGEVARCARCHGDDKSGPLSEHIPDLAGQAERYLLQALDDYANGVRQSGVMQPVASTLTGDQKRAYARYYASLRRRPVENAFAPAGAERSIAADGDPGRGIPPCDSCHGQTALETYPRLAGQSARYLSSQLELWRSGIPRSGPLAGLMAPIAKRLTDEDIRAVSDYYSRQIRPR
jgi:cytochrome c553